MLHGHFFRSSTTDLAVTCVDDTSMRLLVFESGAAAHVEEVVRVPISPTAAQPSSTKVPCVFTRASPKTVRYFCEARSEDPGAADEMNARSAIQPVGHDGIEESQAECCSVIHYWQGERWWTITAMD